MISYDPFWQTLRQRDISTYQLIYEHGILRLRSVKTVTTRTLNTLCSVIGCQISDIVTFVPDDTSDKL